MVTKVPKYEEITETTGTPVTADAADMMITRYVVAAQLASGRRVLELGCGAGQGLGLIEATATSVIGGDYSRPLLDSAVRHYGSRIPLIRLSAESLPFADQAFDLVLFFEASYYVPRMDLAFVEIARVLAPNGLVLFVNANPDRPDFIRSPYSTHYHSASEFEAELQRVGLEVDLRGAFPIDGSGDSRRSLIPPRIARTMRRVLETMRLVPRTLRGRARLKRLIYGRPRPVPAELTVEFGKVAPRTSIDAANSQNFQVLYITGCKRR